MADTLVATTLEPGARGEHVKRLQKALVRFGYDLGRGGADGVFGERTRAAVARFQDSRGLSPTGVADGPTIAAMDLDPETLEDLIEMDAGETRESNSGSLATANGDDIYIDPPVRLLPQWDPRWGDERIAGTGPNLDWAANGCNASTAAMILRWFAEDCTAGSTPFPTKPNGAIDRSWYPLRMAEAFWPEAQPPGKIELTPKGTINFLKLYSIAAHYLKTGEIERRPGGNAIDPSSPRANFVSSRPSEGWLSLIRTMLAMGPVIVGIGAPSGHFVVVHGIMSGGLLIADPGAVLYRAHHGGRGEIQNWSDKDGYLDGEMDWEAVRLPAASQWPDGTAPGREADRRSYHLITGQYLDDLLGQLKSVTSLTYPEGARLAP